MKQNIFGFSARLISSDICYVSGMCSKNIGSLEFFVYAVLSSTYTSFLILQFQTDFCFLKIVFLIFRVKLIFGYRHILTILMGGKKTAKEQAKKFTAKDEKIIKQQIEELKSLGSDFQMPRIKSGIQGLDELIEGGVPKRSLILIAGDTGTGKSTLAMNFLVEGAQNDEPGVYVTLEESASEHALRMKLFGWPIENLIAEKKLAIIQPELYDFDKLIMNIEDAVAKIGARRLVIDSITILHMYFKDPFKVRRSLLTLEKAVKNLNCTTFAVSELKQVGNDLPLTGVEEFLVDGVILLHYIKKENVYSRAMVIRKMRATNHSLKIHPVQIKRPGGVIVYPEEEVFTEL